jgi:hypothetical protein
VMAAITMGRFQSRAADLNHIGVILQRSTAEENIWESADDRPVWFSLRSINLQTVLDARQNVSEVTHEGVMRGGVSLSQGDRILDFDGSTFDVVGIRDAHLERILFVAKQRETVWDHFAVNLYRRLDAREGLSVVGTDTVSGWRDLRNRQTFVAPSDASRPRLVRDMAARRLVKFIAGSQLGLAQDPSTMASTIGRVVLAGRFSPPTTGESILAYASTSGDVAAPRLRLTINSAGQVTASIYANDAATATITITSVDVVERNRWSVITLAWDENGIRLRINGRERIVSGSFAGFASLPSAIFTLGHQSNSDASFAMDLSVAAVWPVINDAGLLAGERWLLERKAQEI